MNSTLELFEQYKLHLGVQADSAAAAALGVKNQTVSNWRTRGSQAEPWLIENMCIALGVDTTEWLLRVQIEQAPDASNKLVWLRMGEKLGYKVASIGVLLISPAAMLEAWFLDSTTILDARLPQLATMFAQLASGLLATA
jgi:hypothetical protein